MLCMRAFFICERTVYIAIVGMAFGTEHDVLEISKVII